MDKFKKKKPNTDGPEITWTRTMMDQNNYGLFGIFFFMDLFFWSIIFQKTVICQDFHVVNVTCFADNNAV